MSSKVLIYKSGIVGYGCLRTFIEVNSENFISETDETITIAEVGSDQWGGMVENDHTYFKTITAFITHENERYVEEIQKLRSQHEKTMLMASKLLKIDKEKKPDTMIPF